MFYYYSTPGGGVAYRESDTPPLVPGDWDVVTEAVYSAALIAIEADVAATQAAAADANLAIRQTAYNEMKASSHFADLSDASIRLLAGYYGA